MPAGHTAATNRHRQAAEQRPGSYQAFYQAIMPAGEILVFKITLAQIPVQYGIVPCQTFDRRYQYVAKTDHVFLQSEVSQKLFKPPCAGAQ